MKWLIVTRIRQWYLLFAAGIFLTIAMLAGILQPFLSTPATTATKIQPLFHGNTTQPKVAFACNVFWGEEFLPSMLQTLKEEDIQITFFIGGSWAKKYPELLSDLAARGHELGNHTYSHPHPNAISKAQNQEQIQKTEDLIKEITGIKTILYAPPYGEYNDMVLTAAHELGYTTTLWSIDTIDWKRPPADVLKNRVTKKLHNGAIILMHPTEPTAKALPTLIKEIKEAGYTISTVSDVLK